MAARQLAEKEKFLTASFDWKIESFCEIPKFVEVKSKVFEFLETCKIWLSLAKDTKIAVFRMNLSIGMLSNMCIHCDLNIIGKNGRTLFSVSSNEKPEYLLTYSIMQLDLEKVKGDLLEGGTLTIRCSLSVEGDREEFGIGNLSTEAVNCRMMRNLCADLEKLYNSKLDTNCVLQAGDFKFPVHRSMLAARSPVFDDMFRKNKLENTGKAEFVLQDIDADTLNDVLLFIYSSKIQMRADTVISIFKAADKYDLPHLKVKCILFLSQNLTLDNICAATLLAHDQGDKTLDTKIVSFIDSNRSQVLARDDWVKLTVDKPLLVQKILFLSAAHRKTMS